MQFMTPARVFAVLLCSLTVACADGGGEGEGAAEGEGEGAAEGEGEGAAEGEGESYVPDDAVATFVVDSVDNGVAFQTGNTYGFTLKDKRGQVFYATYQTSLKDDHASLIDELTLSQTLLDGDGNIIVDGEGRRRIVRLQIDNLAILQGSYECGVNATEEAPGSLVTMDVSIDLRDDELFSQTSLDAYYGYPTGGENIGCTIDIDDVTDGVMTGTYTISGFSYDAEGLLLGHGAFELPIPTCNTTQTQADPLSCQPWLN